MEHRRNGVACALAHYTGAVVPKTEVRSVPLYEYRCQSCSTTFELLRPMADRQLAAVCPSCESRTTMPMISRVALHASAPASVPGPAPRPAGGCGSGCGCH